MELSGTQTYCSLVTLERQAKVFQKVYELI